MAGAFALACPSPALESYPCFLRMEFISLANAQAADAAETNERVPLDESVLMARAGGRG